MARTAKDAAHILQAIAGVDPYDNYTSAIPDGIMPDYITACKLSAVSGSRLGIPRDVISLFKDSTTGPMIEAFGKHWKSCMPPVHRGRRTFELGFANINSQRRLHGQHTKLSGISNIQPNEHHISGRFAQLDSIVPPRAILYERH